jgi:hypothetical protein
MPNYRSLVPGGFFSADPGDRTVPVAIRTNNPGAINLAVWIKSFPGFVDYRETTPNNPTVIFDAPEYGVAAWWELLHRYRSALGPKNFTLRNIAFRYCGRGREKEAVDYTAFVCAKAATTGNVLVDITDHRGLLPIARAFYWFEAGRPTPLSDQQIIYGFDFGQERVPDVQAFLAAGSATLSARTLRHTSSRAAPRSPAAKPSGDVAADRSVALANIAEAEARRGLKWSNAQSEAEKFLRPMREPMRKLGQIGKEPIFFNWCAAFVTWCCRRAGYAIPDQPIGYNATMALVDSWGFWGRQQHLLIDWTTKNVRSGDVLLYEWFDGDSSLDHIGVFLRLRSDGRIEAAEGNARNKTSVVTHDPSNVKAVLRLPA